MGAIGNLGTGGFKGVRNLSGIRRLKKNNNTGGEEKKGRKEKESSGTT